MAMAVDTGVAASFTLPIAAMVMSRIGDLLPGRGLHQLHRRSIR